MMTDDMVAALEDFLDADTDGKLENEILSALERMQHRLDVESKKMHLRSTFETIDGARQAVQAALLAMTLHQTGTRNDPTHPMPTKHGGKHG